MNKLLLVLLLILNTSVFAEKVGEVSTVYKLMGANDKIVVEAFQDPKVSGVTCYLSRATTGGMTGLLGLAEDKSEAAISCVKTKPVLDIASEVLKGEEEGYDVFKRSTSILFKSIQVVRFYDSHRKVLVYLAYSDKIIDGSPNNAISVVYAK